MGLAKHINLHLPKRGFGEDPFKQCQPVHSENHDEDHKKHLSHDVMKNGGHTSGFSFCKKDGVDGRRYREWQTANLASLQCAGHRKFKGFAGVLNLAEDGARLGRPAEETVVYLAHSPRLGDAVWFPPQVPVCITCMKHEFAGVQFVRTH